MRGSVASAIVLGVLGTVWIYGGPANAAAPVDVRVSSSGLNPAFVMRGDSATAGFQVEGPSTDSTMTVTLPTSPAVTFQSVTNDETQSAVSCVSVPLTHTYTCHTGALGFQQLYSVQYAVASAAAIGGSGAITVKVDPLPGPDANPSDNTASVAFTVAGHATLHDVVSPHPGKITLDGQTVLHATVRNDGPDPANHVIMRLVLQSNPSARMRFGKFTSTAVSVSDPRTATWTIGSIAAGSQATLDVPVRSTGPMTFGELGFSTSADGIAEVCDVRSCVNGDPISIIAAPRPQPPTSTPILASTGFNPTQPLGLATILLLAGTAACALAARPRRAPIPPRER